MPVFIHNGLYLGLASVYHEGDRTAPDFDCVDLELTYASDPTEFYYAAYGEPFIPRGKGTYHNGEFDCCCIFAAPPIIKDGKMHFYYMGGNGHHTNFRETSFGCITYDEDKFAYIAPTTKDESATVVTSAIKVEGDDLWILADFEENASLKAAVCAGSKYDPKDGFAFEDCKFTKDASGWTKITFEKPLSELGGENCCVHFELKNVKLYAMKGDITCVSNKY